MAQENVVAPRLPVAPDVYDRAYQDQLTNLLRLYFNQLDNPSGMVGATLNLNLNTLPTQADLPNLRLGDVYRDTVDGIQDTSQMLRIKTSL
jgi:hypothetical protein